MAFPSSSTTLTSSQIRRHIDLLPRSVEQRELIHHWITFVPRHLVPVDSIENPFRNVLTPMALEGMNAPSSEPNACVALFHSLCSASAFSRGQFLNDDKVLTLAKKHYHLALLHLRCGLANLSSSFTRDFNTQRDAIIATITVFTVIDMITGRSSSEWRIHLQGGSFLLPVVKDRTWGSSKSSSLIYQSYLAVAVICNIDFPSNMNLRTDGCQYYVLDSLFGLTRSVLRNLMTFNSLLAKSGREDADASLPEALLRGLQTETSMDNLSKPSFRVKMDVKETAEVDMGLPKQLAHLHAVAFRLASRIYFERTILHTPASQLQHLIAAAVQNFEDIERLGADAVGCTLIWPPLIVASECMGHDLQSRMLSWYKAKRRHGFNNLEVSKDVAMEVWRRREGAMGDTDVQWQNMLAYLNLDIVLA